MSVLKLWSGFSGDRGVGDCSSVQGVKRHGVGHS